MRLTRLFDKESDIYEEVVIDPDTGDVIHQNKEPLTKHQGHGSAKQKHWIRPRISDLVYKDTQMFRNLAVTESDSPIIEK